ncbi:MAG: hypothetical protein GY851_29360, partial [bacterium]|nr:hypothetical protein [bacterium]
MAIIDLGDLSWTLTGWRPYVWKCSKSMETGVDLGCDVGPIPAKAPGSVQQMLLDAGIVEDWHKGVNSRSCEWIEHRHWYFETILPAGFVPQGERVCLDAKGLDYSGWILVDGLQVAEFAGALVPHRFDLTSCMADGAEHRLGIMFDEPPAEQGQFGYTSRSKHFKSRYNYSWDWCPRVVPVGAWDSLELR